MCAHTLRAYLHFGLLHRLKCTTFQADDSFRKVEVRNELYAVKLYTLQRYALHDICALLKILLILFDQTYFRFILFKFECHTMNNIENDESVEV